MSQIYKKILIVKRFGVKKIGENVTVKQNEAIKSLTPNPQSPPTPPPPPPPPPPPARPPPPPPRRGGGRDHRGYPYFAACFLIGVCC